MTIFQIIDAFTFYGLDIVVLAILTCLFTQLLKVTLLRKCQKKIITFLPFIFGCLLYAAYLALVEQSARVLIVSYVSILEHGFSVGTLSTIIYVAYEQFVRGKDADAARGVIATLINGYVPDAELESIAESICDAIRRDVTGCGADETARILAENCVEGITEKDVKLLARLIIETLVHMNT